MKNRTVIRSYKKKYPVEKQIVFVKYTAREEGIHREEAITIISSGRRDIDRGPEM